MSKTDRNIPLPIQRAVRRRCGFGCVICGLPLYEYEHLLGWANVRRHVADEITLLCDKHHREKTSGLLPLTDVVAADKDPMNKRTGVSGTYDLHYSGTNVVVSLGNVDFKMEKSRMMEDNPFVAIVIDNRCILGFIFENNHLLLEAKLFDKFNHLALSIERNQLIYSTSSWDIQFVGKNLIIRENEGQFLLDMTFDVPNKFVVNRGRLLYNGAEIIIEPNLVKIPGQAEFSDIIVDNFAIGLAIGRLPPNVGPTAFLAEDVDRYQARAK